MGEEKREENSRKYEEVGGAGQKRAEKRQKRQRVQAVLYNYIKSSLFRNEC
jgi:hypothetical protein